MVLPFTFCLRLKNFYQWIKFYCCNDLNKYICNFKSLFGMSFAVCNDRFVHDEHNRFVPLLWFLIFWLLFLSAYIHTHVNGNRASERERHTHTHLTASVCIHFLCGSALWRENFNLFFTQRHCYSTPAVRECVHVLCCMYMYMHWNSLLVSLSLKCTAIGVVFMLFCIFSFIWVVILFFFIFLFHVCVWNARYHGVLVLIVFYNLVFLVPKMKTK